MDMGTCRILHLNFDQPVPPACALLFATEGDTGALLARTTRAVPYSRDRRGHGKAFWGDKLLLYCGRSWLQDGRPV
ncbi:hypothetical protein BD309DRAFT_969132 [Dichomitus squalens]|nr:hypothetical protein BD309DRAFT_969132 [Dichomitus squalens]